MYNGVATTGAAARGAGTAAGGGAGAGPRVAAPITRRIDGREAWIMRRVMVIGQPGSGKSTFARALGSATGLPVVHMDHIHWMSGWRERPREEKLRLVREVEARDAWILEGGLSATYDERAGRADTIIHLDAPVWPRLWRVVARSIRHWGRSRPDLPDGCPERFGFHQWEFYHFVWRTRRTARERMVRLTTEHARNDAKRVVTLHSFAEQDAFVLEAYSVG